MDPEISRTGARHIAQVDSRMAAIIEAHGELEIGQRRPRYAALVRSIVGQQISTKAAQSVYMKLRRAAGGLVAADRVGSLSMDELRGAGLSGQKARYIHDLTQRVRSRQVRLEHLHRRTEEEVIAELTTIKGVGRWTAEMFLMFVLGRTDVLPVDDLGIQNGFIRVYGLRKRPSPDRMERLAAPWRPYRTIGCYYLWRSLANTPT